MIIEPKVRGFICTAAHPVGCEQAVARQIEYVKQQGSLTSAPRTVLVIGCSTGYGLATRIVEAFGAASATIGVCFERPAAGKRTATAGWYNTAAFERAAKDAGVFAKTINGDAFSDEIKQQVITCIKDYGRKIDTVVYSLASPRRKDPDSAEVYQSVLKTTGQTYVNKSVDVMRGELKEVTIEAATPVEIDQTIAVMGGADLERWTDQLLAADVLAEGAQVIAYSYIGPELTYPIYRDGTIGKAKDDVLSVCHRLEDKLQAIGGSAQVAVNKAVVTQASAAIPVVPLYLSVLHKVMVEKGVEEGCIEQMHRLARDYTYASVPLERDAEGRIRIDNWELRDDVQAEVSRIWSQISSENLDQLTDLAAYQEQFFQLFGFRLPGVDYSAEVDPVQSIPSIESEEAG